MAELGGKPPPKRGGGEKKSGGGFWGVVSDFFSNVSIDVSVGKPGRGRAGAPHDPTDPSERMEPVRQDRQESYEETIYRKTEGASGTAPAVRVDRDRKSIARSLESRTGGGQQQGGVPKGGGEPLSSDVRARMEPRLGSDLSDVRVHAGGGSAEAAEGLSAKAFTVGKDVHFGAGNYQPGTKEGDRLIAHELTHVVQGQRSGVQRKADEGHDGGEHDSEADVSHPDDPAEKEADHVADALTEDLHGDGDAKDAKGKEHAGGGAAAGANKGGAEAAAKGGGESKSAGDARGGKAGGAKEGAGAKAEGAKAEGAKAEGAKAEGAKAEGGAAGGAKPGAADGNAGEHSDAKSGGGGNKAPAAEPKATPAPIATKRKEDSILRTPISQSFVGVGRKIHRKKAPPPAAPPPTSAGKKPGAAGAPPAKEPPRPPTALRVSPIEVNVAAPEFADAFAKLPVGKSAGFQGGPSGSPAQVGEAISKRPGASMDAGGTLTLPPIDASAVAGATSPQDAAARIGAATGVSKVNLIGGEDFLDFEVEVNPLAPAGKAKPKSPSERAEFKTALKKLDPSVAPVVTKIIDERKIRYTRAPSWADARTKLETEPDIKRILEKPFNQGHAFGDAAHAVGITQLNKALKASGSTPLQALEAGTKISHWKPQVNDEVSPFEGINPALREQVWDGGKKTQAGQAMFTAFDARLKLGEDEEHDWYRPQNRKEVAVAGGGTRITYSNSKGADFEIDVGADGMIESITGSHLTLKEPGSRGATGQAGRAVPNEKIESCHLIADQFRGSGYKSSANLIAASQTYNQQEMKGAETTIANFIKNMKATEFDMTVGVKWMDVDVTKAVAALEKRYPDVMKPKLKAKIQQELTDFITRMKSASPNLKRVKETKYTVKVKDPKGVEIPMDPAPKLGMDIWLGTSSAPAG